MPTQEAVLDVLKHVTDPELPFLSVIDLGMIEQVEVSPEGKVHVVMLPTFAGCPALEWLKENIRSAVENLPGVSAVEVEVSLAKTWSTNRMTEAARQKLKEKGIAPPHTYTGTLDVSSLQKPIPCPYCGSENTELRSPFGPALCRAFYRCNDCGQTFERFKPV